MKIQIYDPPMCCSTGICGPGVDPVLVEFTADIDWLKRQGIEVERYNLSQQTQAFVSNSTVTDALNKHGNECLPLILIDGKIVAQGAYPSRQSLASLAGVESPKIGLKVTIEPSAGSACCSGPAPKEDACCDESTDKKTSNKKSCC